VQTRRQIVNHVFGLALGLVGCDTDEESGKADEATPGEITEPMCELVDAWEPNPSAKKPAMVSWQSVDEWVAHRQLDEAYLCPGEGDWYYFDVESLGYEVHYLYVRALIEEAGLCGADCDQPVIPEGPEHAMTIEIHRADDLKLLSSTTQEDGVIAINGPGGDEYAHDLLIHVFSATPKAEYSYSLSVQIRNYDGEDECEC
jgi:hypothetical protein